MEEGVETERSSNGTASRAIEGDTLGEGESGRCVGEARPLSVSLWLVVGLEETSTVSAMVKHTRESRWSTVPSYFQICT